MTAFTTTTIHDIGALRRHASGLRTVMLIALVAALAIVAVVLMQSGSGARQPAPGDPFSHSPPVRTMPIVPGPVGT
jgi:hypothetical protein